VSENTWSSSEQIIAKKAFDLAYHREIKALIQEVKAIAISLSEIEDVWSLHDFLSARRHQIDGKYDYNYAVLIFIFAQLLKEGWLLLDDLDGLERDKVSKINALAKMS
jgi:hypothetical protein